MGFWINVGILACVIIAATVGIVIAIVKYGKEDEYLDSTLGVNFMASYCDGVAMGIEKSSILGKEGRKIITLSPRDINPHNVDNIKDIKVIVDKAKCITLPKGVWSRDKNINIYLPPSIEDFPKPLRETLFGKLLMLLTSITDASNAEITALQEGMKRQSAHIKSMATGEVSLEKMTQIEEIYSDLLEASKEGRRGDKFPSPGTMTPPPR